MSKTFSQTSIGAGDVYINGIDVGLMQGPINFTYTPTMLPLKVGIPLQEVGSYIVEEESKLEFPVLEFSAENLAAIIGRDLVQVTQEVNVTDETITFTSDVMTLAHTPVDPADVVVTDVDLHPFTNGVDFTVVGGTISRIGGSIPPGATVLVDYAYNQVVGDRLDFGGTVTLDEVQVQVVAQNPRFLWKETVVLPRARTNGALTLTWDSTANKYRTTNAVFMGLATDNPNWATCKLGAYYKERVANSGTVTVLAVGDPPPGVVPVS